MLSFMSRLRRLLILCRPTRPKEYFLGSKNREYRSCCPAFTLVISPGRNFLCRFKKAFSKEIFFCFSDVF